MLLKTYQGQKMAVLGQEPCSAPPSPGKGQQELHTPLVPGHQQGTANPAWAIAGPSSSKAFVGAVRNAVGQT